MKTTMIMVGAGMLGSIGAVGIGCFDLEDDCFQTLTCVVTSMSSNSTSSSGTGGHDGGTGGTGGHTNCDPTVGAVDGGCGVFVSSSQGDDTNAGTESAPLKSFAAALTKAGAGRVYACGENFTEVVSISASVTIYGALVCSQTWMYDATQKTQLTTTADAIPLTLASTASGTVVHDFAITAADAMAPGGSSIAVLDQAGVTLENVDLTAGKGAAGAPGMMQTALTAPTAAAGGNGGADAACNMPGVLGGAGGKNTCGTATSGGLGGTGVANVTGGAGSPGDPTIASNNAGTGQDESTTPTTACQAGGQGVQGTTGTPGTGARGIGDVSAVGYAGPAGMLGGTGGPGQGGGGGGGAAQCDMSGMYAGPSGGGGGAGGCGGAPGNFAQSGGSSFGILALGVTPVLMTVSITTHDGGAGGTGGDGQTSAGGTAGSAGGAGACAGGSGGPGGAGGPGGGGAGGHSVAVAVMGGALPDLNGMNITLGNGGAGGPGGDMDMTAQTKGDGGMACNTLDFTPLATTPCAM
jgi:hypothetical protein